MSSCKPSQITHVIFDLDGLLLDTESLSTRVTQKILDRFGLKIEWSIKSKMMGRKPIDAATVLIDSLKLPMTPEEFNTERFGILTKQFPDAGLMPGAAELIRHFHNIGMPLAICTGSTKHIYEAKVSKHKDLFSSFSHVVCADDKEVKIGKPAPDMYLAAARRFRNRPKSSRNVLVFEDAPNGVESAKIAGMNVVMVPDKRTDPELCRKADQVVNSLEDLELSGWGLEPLSTEFIVSC